MKKTNQTKRNKISFFFRLENKTFYSINGLEVCDVYMSHKSFTNITKKRKCNFFFTERSHIMQKSLYNCFLTSMYFRPVSQLPQKIDP